MINAKTQKEIDRLSDDLISNFAPPEYIPGCKVTAIIDKDEYATDNGWIVAICGRHNNQRCRWTGQLSSIAINDYVDVLYYPSYKLFVVFGQGGTSDAQSGKYLLIDGTRDSTGEQDFTAGIKTDAVAESTATAGVTVDGVLNKDSDVYPQSSANGLNARFERLFGDDVPAINYALFSNTLLADNVASNILGFDTNTTQGTDSYTPASPFSKSNSGSVYFYTLNSHLKINSLAGSAKLIWSSATGVSQWYIWGQFSARSTTTYGAEIRLFDVETPGGSDEYWALKFTLDVTTYPSWPWRVLVTSGIGITYPNGSETVHANYSYNPATVMRWGMRAYDSGGTPRFDADFMELAGGDVVNIGGVLQANCPNTVKRIEIYIDTSYQTATIDSIQAAF